MAEAQEPGDGAAAGAAGAPQSPPAPPVPPVPAGPLAGPGGARAALDAAAGAVPAADRATGAPRRRGGPLLLAGATAVLLLATAGGYAGAALHAGLAHVPPSPALSLQPAAAVGPGAAAAGAPAAGPDAAGSLRAVAARVLPSVVTVHATGRAADSTGSGFVVRSDGLVVTNDHVVAAAAGGGRVHVVFSDGTSATARVLGRTATYDLAVLQVARTGLPALPFADSARVAVGDPVAAVGAPLGLRGTVTSGIVSAVDRPVSAGDAGAASYIDALQTDAAINPGNSGGPLVDLSGRVVGVATAIAAAPGAAAGAGSIGLGFAIPSAQVVRTSQQLIAHGRATYPVLGVLLDQAWRGDGVRVASTGGAGPAVVPGGPADRAGVRPGDVITALDGRPVTDPSELVVAVRAHEPGESVTLSVRRDGADRPVVLVLDGAESD